MSKEDLPICAVILVGGRGRRFWPLSRRNKPKPFLSVGKDDSSLLRVTLNRVRQVAGIKDVILVANRAHYNMLIKQFPEVRRRNIIREPMSKNTAPAIALACLNLIGRIGGDSIMAVFPSDQHISNEKKFRRTIIRGIEFVKRNDSLVVLGIRPTHASTGFGYIKKGKRVTGTRGSGLFKVEKFVEKPGLNRARRFLKSGQYLWNAGIFIWRTKTILANIKKFRPALYRVISRTKAAYRRLKDESIDFAVIEKAKDVFCIEADFGWHDIGSWSSLADIYKGDPNGNVTLGECEIYDADNSVSVGAPGHLVCLCGVSGLVIVHTKDSTLVCSKEKAEEVKALVEQLERKKNRKRYL